MKGIIPVKISMIFLISIIIPCESISATKQDQKIIEKMNIARVLVQVRVFHAGIPVKNLEKKDFKLYEDNQLQKIENFFRKKGKIKIQKLLIKTNPGSITISPRYFVLIFRITDYTEDLDKGINFFFDSILQKKDELLIFANNKTMFFGPNSRHGLKIKEIVIESLKEQAVIAEKQISQYMVKMERDLNVIQFTQRFEQAEEFGLLSTIDFFNKYLRSWIEFKKQFLIPDLNKYYNFARHLENIKKEKWVINFFQFDKFPRINISPAIRIKLEVLINHYMVSNMEIGVTNARKLKGLLIRINREFNPHKDFPSQKLNKLFYKINATFHTIVIKSRKKLSSKNLEFRRVLSNLGNCLENLALNTGGKLIITDNISAALEEITDWETFYYLLSYIPRNKRGNKKIKIKVSHPRYRVIYDNNVRSDYIAEFLKNRKRPAIQLTGMRFSSGNLSMRIYDYFLPGVKGKPGGKILVKVLVKDQDNKRIYREEKYIIVKKEFINISIDFNWLKEGKYFLIAEVIDLLTQKSSMNFLEV